KENSRRYPFTHHLTEIDNHSAQCPPIFHPFEHPRELKLSNPLLYTHSKLIQHTMLQRKLKNTNFKLCFQNIQILHQTVHFIFLKSIPPKQNKQPNQLPQQ
uniref:ribonuclease H n=1 Tax=Staphylococcus epidermidis TaxID=1282 RepID=UPI001C92F3EE